LTSVTPSWRKLYVEMTAYAPQLTAFEVRATDQPRERHDTALHMRLRPTGDGWSLMTDDGVVVFRGLGLGSRRECLRRARELGALSVRA
jgi:hypothetical protein